MDCERGALPAELLAQSYQLLTSLYISQLPLGQEIGTGPGWSPRLLNFMELGSLRRIGLRGRPNCIPDCE